MPDMPAENSRLDGHRKRKSRHVDVEKEEKRHECQHRKGLSYEMVESHNEHSGHENSHVRLTGGEAGGEGTDGDDEATRRERKRAKKEAKKARKEAKELRKKESRKMRDGGHGGADGLPSPGVEAHREGTDGFQNIGGDSGQVWEGDKGDADAKIARREGDYAGGAEPNKANKQLAASGGGNGGSDSDGLAKKKAKKEKRKSKDTSGMDKDEHKNRSGDRKARKEHSKRRKSDASLSDGGVPARKKKARLEKAPDAINEEKKHRKQAEVETLAADADDDGMVLNIQWDVTGSQGEDQSGDDSIQRKTEETSSPVQTKDKPKRTRDKQSKGSKKSDIFVDDGPDDDLWKKGQEERVGNEADDVSLPLWKRVIAMSPKLEIPHWSTWDPQPETEADKKRKEAGKPPKGRKFKYMKSQDIEELIKVRARQLLDGDVS
ncbi:hypothetical protein BDY21DRAFT_192594 [Lineolata rhizophorae]|uniref:Uncharacterized protein n=1 Tax=Lineolata rhizophorae TaxID=578093 RepID=A0A6A6P6D1_9PEZI|nr:hypothetical protein BDY21DRAFT_192594 [Lineolata rhizophorae]